MVDLEMGNVAELEELNRDPPEELLEDVLREMTQEQLLKRIQRTQQVVTPPLVGEGWWKRKKLKHVAFLVMVNTIVIVIAGVGIHLIESDHMIQTVVDGIILMWTVASTIGFGHKVPKTPQGQAMLLLTGLFVGLPLYNALRTALQSFIRTFMLTTRKKILCLLLIVLVGALVECAEEMWEHAKPGHTFLETLYLFFISATTIGLGDFVPNGDWLTLPFILFVLLADVFISLIYADIGFHLRHSTMKWIQFAVTKYTTYFYD